MFNLNKFTTKLRIIFIISFIGRFTHTLINPETIVILLLQRSNKTYGSLYSTFPDTHFGVAVKHKHTSNKIFIWSGQILCIIWKVVACFFCIVIKYRVGLGGLGVTWSPRYQRFAGSNLTEVDGFFQDVKILSTNPPRGTLSWGSRVWDFRLVKEPEAWKNRPLSKI